MNIVSPEMGALLQCLKQVLDTVIKLTFAVIGSVANNDGIVKPHNSLAHKHFKHLFYYLFEANNLRSHPSSAVVRVTVRQLLNIQAMLARIGQAP